MKISNLIEQIFAQAVALNQSGGLRNTIYAIGHEVFILNYDHTVLLRFRLRKTEPTFEYPIAFKADDYDSNIFEEKDGHIIFHSENEGYSRKKICGTTDLTPEHVQDLWSEYMEESEEKRETVTISDSVLSLLEENLSHIEFVGKKGGKLTLIQRNIYSGGIIEIAEKQSGLFQQKLKQDFGPVAMKTDDFRALFTFESNLEFSFPTVSGKEDFVKIKSLNESKRNMKAIVALCLYDEIIKIKQSKVKAGDSIDEKPKTIRRTK